MNVTEEVLNKVFQPKCYGQIPFDVSPCFKCSFLDRCAEQFRKHLEIINKRVKEINAFLQEKET